MTTSRVSILLPLTCAALLSSGHGLTRRDSTPDEAAKAAASDLAAVNAAARAAYRAARERVLARSGPVVLFDGEDVVEVIRTLRPDVQVKGTDYTPETIPEAGEVRSYGGRLAVAGDPKAHSTTRLLEELRRGGGESPGSGGDGSGGRG